MQAIHEVYSFLLAFTSLRQTDRYTPGFFGLFSIKKAPENLGPRRCLSLFLRREGKGSEARQVFVFYPASSDLVNMLYLLLFTGL